MTLEEMMEWTQISATVRHVVDSLEQCSRCKRITECETLPYAEGYFCRDCLYEMMMVKS